MICDLTREQLAAWTAGDLAAPDAQSTRAHVATCDRCRQRVDALREVDGLLGGLAASDPPPDVVTRARHGVMRAVGAASAPEVMTLDEVAELLRVTPDELESVVRELPLFELAGRLRIRRSRLMDWIESRERRYERGRTHNEVAGLLAGRFGGVA